MTGESPDKGEIPAMTSLTQVWLNSLSSVENQRRFTVRIAEFKSLSLEVQLPAKASEAHRNTWHTWKQTLHSHRIKETLCWCLSLMSPEGKTSVMSHGLSVQHIFPLTPLTDQVISITELSLLRAQPQIKPCPIEIFNYTLCVYVTFAGLHVMIISFPGATQWTKDKSLWLGCVLCNANT